jgi:hypothetical protein
MQKYRLPLIREVPIPSDEEARLPQPIAYYYRADEVDTRIADLKKALRAVSIIDLGFGVPKYFCAACVSYGDGPESIRHKAECVTAQALSLMER